MASPHACVQAYSDLYSVTLYSATTAATTNPFDNFEVYVSNTTNATLALSTGVACGTALGLISAAPGLTSGMSVTLPLTVLCPTVPNARHVVLARKPVTSSETLTLDEIVVNRASEGGWLGCIDPCTYVV